MAFCKTAQDLNAHIENLEKDDSFDDAVESLAEDLMADIQNLINVKLRFDNNFKLTRADIFDMCSNDEFNNVFYEMAEKAIKKGEL